jgi:phospholipase/lecithinase/hemolysin
VALFVFGDSTFDPGNNNNLHTIARANFWPYGETYFNFPSGRFCDGRLISDFIAEFAKLPLIPPYVRQSAAKYEVKYGVNFASAGAGALVETNRGLARDLNTQLNYFKNVEKKLKRTLRNKAEAKRLLSNAVYLISIGSNDYMSNMSIYKYYGKEEYVGMVVGNLTTLIKEIYKMGGRKFGVPKQGLLGCIPAMRMLQPEGDCLAELNLLMVDHNNALSKALEELERRLDGFVYSSHDFYISSGERVKNPAKYGFKEGKVACCGSGSFRGNSSCGGMRGDKVYELCENVNDHLFFDFAHETEKANRQYAELMWSGSPNMTGPYNLKTLFNTVN